MSEQQPAKRRATYQDVLDAPEHKIAEIFDGELVLSPRPAGPHSAVFTLLLGELVKPFMRGGSGGPGGWIILGEPELHLGDDVCVPDIGGWRRERLPSIGNAAYFTTPPDWVCEVLSKSTERHDRLKKLKIYARAGVQYAWLVSPRMRSLEVLRLHDGMWTLLAMHVDDERVRAAPFEAIELELGALWKDLPPPPPKHAAESSAAYDIW